MEKPRLEVVILSSEGLGCPKRPGPALEEEQPVKKRPRITAPVYPLEWEACLQPHRACFGSSTYMPTASKTSCHTSKMEGQVSDKQNPSSDFVAPTRACPPLRLLPTQPQKKKTRRATYDPNDFTSDELDPAFEWPRESPPARKYGAKVALLKSILGQFPLGLHLDKLVSLMWKEYKVHLWKLGMEQGYVDVLQFLEEVPGVRLSRSKGRSHFLVQMV